eukprot:11842975-Alexandrium_andersonii.AAC.1
MERLLGEQRKDPRLSAWPGGGLTQAEVAPQGVASGYKVACRALQRAATRLPRAARLTFSHSTKGAPPPQR